MRRKEIMMKIGRKLGWTMGAALGIGLSAPALANEEMQYAPQTSMSDTSGTQGAGLTLIVSEPSLVFSDGAWYTYVDGVWHQFDGNEWQNLSETSFYSSSYADDSIAASSDEAIADDYAYLGDDGVWFVWMPVSYADSESIEYDVSALSPAYYEVELTSVNDVPVYSYDDGQWYVLVPMTTDEMPTHVVYLY